MRDDGIIGTITRLSCSKALSCNQTFQKSFDKIFAKNKMKRTKRSKNLLCREKTFKQANFCISADGIDIFKPIADTEKSFNSSSLVLAIIVGLSSKMRVSLATISLKNGDIGFSQ